MIVTSIPLVNGDRLNRSIAQLAEIGKLANGGVSRVAFTPEDLLARQLVQSWMIDAGITVRIDAVGNIIGTYAGLQAAVGALATGSHIDVAVCAQSRQARLCELVARESRYHQHRRRRLASRFSIGRARL